MQINWKLVKYCCAMCSFYGFPHAETAADWKPESNLPCDSNLLVYADQEKNRKGVE